MKNKYHIVISVALQVVLFSEATCFASTAPFDDGVTEVEAVFRAARTNECWRTEDLTFAIVRAEQAFADLDTIQEMRSKAEYYYWRFTDRGQAVLARFV